MALKSASYYHARNREMKTVLESLETKERTGWIRGMYAEKSKTTKELSVKTYANKTQCLKKVAALQEQGVNCDMSLRYPFVIVKIEDKQDKETEF